MIARVALVLCVAACGRLGFDTPTTGTDDARRDGPSGLDDAIPGDDAMVAGDAMPDAPTPGQVVCNLDCTYTNDVNARCSIAGCQMTCDVGATCRFECPLGGCDFICTNGAMCTTTCGAGQCDTTTDNGATSTGTCFGQCTVDCDVSADTCSQTCQLAPSCDCTGC